MFTYFFFIIYFLFHSLEKFEENYETRPLRSHLLVVGLGNWYRFKKKYLLRSDTKLRTTY